jgi:hypothetical protein
VVVDYVVEGGKEGGGGGGGGGGSWDFLLQRSTPTCMAAAIAIAISKKHTKNTKNTRNKQYQKSKGNNNTAFSIRKPSHTLYIHTYISSSADVRILRPTSSNFILHPPPEFSNPEYMLPVGPL